MKILFFTITYNLLSKAAQKAQLYRILYTYSDSNASCLHCPVSLPSRVAVLRRTMHPPSCPQGCQHSHPRTYTCIALHGNTDFANVIKYMNLTIQLTLDYLGKLILIMSLYN